MYENRNKTLAVKYRPSTFDDVVEQDSTKLILEEQLRTGSCKQAYLFCGGAGTGKTTSARIFANRLNDGKGNAIEIDAASNNGVDDVREIIDNSKRKALDGKYKVFIIDECHAFSQNAWGAMLKLLEEPPKGTVYIMCTTDPHKIPDTIISRVQRFDFNKISFERIVDRLKFIINSEYEEGYDFSAEDEALEHIAKLAEGGMRDAITMLDKCLSYSSQVTIGNVVSALGTVDYDDYFAFMNALTTEWLQNALEIVEHAHEDGKDLKLFMRQFQNFLVDVIKCKVFNSIKYSKIPNTGQNMQRINDENTSDLTKLLKWTVELCNDIKWDSNPKYLIQTSIIVYMRELGECRE